MKGKTIVVLVILLLCAHPTSAIIYFNDGQIHNIDYAIYDGVRVDFEAPGTQTTVNLPSEGYIAESLHGYNDSRLNISGGRISKFLWAHGSSQVNISDGSIGFFCSWDSSQANISGGSINDLVSYGSSQIDIFGGSIWRLFGDSSSQVNITGGEIEGGLYLWYQSVIQIFGYDFAVDGTPFGYGELGSILGGSPWYEPLRHLTGTLLSGELIDTDFYIGEDAKIVLIPEPASAMLLGLGSFFFALRRRRQ